MIKFLFEPKKAFRSFTQLIMEDCDRKKSSESTAFWAVFVKYYPRPHMLIGFCDVRLDYNSHLVSGGTKVHLLNCLGETDF